MNADKVNLFLAYKEGYFPPESIPMLRERLLYANPDKEMLVNSRNYVNPIVNLLISIFLGELGIDRFLIGDIGIGIGKLLLTLSCGVGVIWWFIDLFFIMKDTRTKNLERIMNVL